MGAFCRIVFKIYSYLERSVKTILHACLCRMILINRFNVYAQPCKRPKSMGCQSQHYSAALQVTGVLITKNDRFSVFSASI